MQQGRPEVGKRDFRYIVAGLGGIGSAALYWLSRGAGAGR